MGEVRWPRPRNDSRGLITRAASLRSIAAACILAAAQPCAANGELNLTAQFTRPNAGGDVDDSFIVKLPRQVAHPCVAISADLAWILVSRAHLEGLRAKRRGAKWKDEAERIAMIRGDRAGDLLQSARPDPIAGCTERVEGAPHDAMYLVTELLDAGHAMVIDLRGLRVTDRMRVRFVAARGIAGRVNYYLDRGVLFLTMTWWVS